MNSDEPKSKNTEEAGPLIQLSQVDVGSGEEEEAAEIEGIDWSVNEGDFWVVGGARGAGKTDLLSTIAGLQIPLRGEIRLFGHDIAGLPEHEFMEQRKHLGLVFKSGGRMFMQLTVAENIALPLRYHNDWKIDDAAEPVDKLLELTGLADLAHNTVGMLNASAQQRLGLARALALAPKILFLDEPLANLELREQDWWLDVLGKISGGTDSLPSTTLVVTTKSWQPWRERGQQFAEIRGKHWRVLQDRPEVNASAMEIVE